MAWTSLDKPGHDGRNELFSTGNARWRGGGVAEFTGDVLRELLGGVGNALAFSVHYQFDRRQRRKAVLLAEAADVGSDGAARKHRDGKAGKYRGLKSGDAVADRADRPLLSGGAQRLERVMTVDASLRQHRQRKRLARFQGCCRPQRPTPAARDVPVRRDGTRADWSSARCRSHCVPAPRGGGCCGCSATGFPRSGGSARNFRALPAEYRGRRDPGFPA